VASSASSSAANTSCTVSSWIFYCVAERLVLELEGDAHDGWDRQIYDAARAEFLEGAGYRVVRVRNRDVTREQLEAVIEDALRKSLLVPPLPKGEGDRG